MHSMAAADIIISLLCGCILGCSRDANARPCSSARAGTHTTSLGLVRDVRVGALCTQLELSADDTGFYISSLGSGI